MKNVHAAPLMLLVAAAACHKTPPADTNAGAGSNAPAASSAPAAAAPPPAPEVPALMEFEGEVDLVAKSTTSPTPLSFAMLVKDQTYRVDLPPEALAAKEARAITGGGKVYAIVKPADKKAFVVLDGKREAVAIDFDTMMQQAKAYRGKGPGAGPNGAAETPPTVTKTGKKETVAGFQCEDWNIVAADHSKMEVCVAEKATSFFHFAFPGIPTEHAWALELIDGKHTPLKGVGFGKDGMETGRLEVTKIDAHKVEASQLEVPLGYKQVSLDEMMGALGGGGAMPDMHDMPHGAGQHHGKHHKH